MEVITSGRLNARVGFASYIATFAICFFFSFAYSISNSTIKM